MLGAFILRQPIAAFIGVFITLAGLAFFLAGFGLAVVVQSRCCEDAAGKTTTGQTLVSIACLIWLLGAVLFAVLPVLLWVPKEAPPVNVAYAMFGFILSFVPAVMLPQIGNERAEESPTQWAIASTFWLTFVPAAVAFSIAFRTMGWRGGN